jgi:pimeloyl-ACP methyl ester carboxylesterase
VAGTILPAVTARLAARVRHLVFVAGIAAPDRERPLDVFLPDRTEAAVARLQVLRQRYGGQTLESIDLKAASAIDSLNYSSQTMSWAGVPDSLPRTFIRCLRDPIQPRALQDRFIANCAANDVIEIDTGHTPASEAPAALAAALDRLLDRVVTEVHLTPLPGEPR